MSTAVSIPNSVFRSAERLATRLGLSRSVLYCRALRTPFPKGLRFDREEANAR